MMIRIAAATILVTSAPLTFAHDRHHHRHGDERPLELTPIASFDAGEAGSAEIVAYHADTRRVFVVNAATSTVDILDVRNPRAPVKLKTIDTSALGSPNSVAVHDDLVAVAIQSDPKTGTGHVSFYKPSG